ncbi:MAG: HEAT repeat domain-containing protein [Nitrospira sp.]|nr:HEAT repeat domain-containing protein [Nitrospira sp.]MBH0183623.1 HEAT repeat domain-containing protein [Nitrospira sp.]
MNEFAGAGGRGGWCVVALCSLLIGCGSPVSDTPASLESRAESGKLKDHTGTTQPRGTIGQAPQSVPATGFSDTRHQDNEGMLSLPLNISVATTMDLSSPDARVRYRALDYWEAKGSTAPLDPVFKAMEDDDPAVRAKATAIVEQRWAAEQEREKS